MFLYQPVFAGGGLAQSPQDLFGPMRVPASLVIVFLTAAAVSHAHRAGGLLSTASAGVVAGPAAHWRPVNPLASSATAGPRVGMLLSVPGVLPLPSTFPATSSKLQGDRFRLGRGRGRT